MTEPKWLRAGPVIELHHRMVTEFGGAGYSVDENKLESALANPQWLYLYNDDPPSLFALAARYASALAQNHAFADGNKRTALLAAQLFLDINDTPTDFDENTGVVMMVALTDGSITEDDFAHWLESAHALGQVRRLRPEEVPTLWRRIMAKFRR